MRQKKVRNNSCIVANDFKHEIKFCMNSYAPAFEEKSSFGPCENLDAENCTVEAYVFPKRSKPSILCFWNSLGLNILHQLHYSDFAQQEKWVNTIRVDIFIHLLHLKKNSKVKSLNWKKSKTIERTILVRTFWILIVFGSHLVLEQLSLISQFTTPISICSVKCSEWFEFPLKDMPYVVSSM